MPSLVLPSDAPGADPLAALAPLRRAYGSLLLRALSTARDLAPASRPVWTSLVTRLGQLARTRPAVVTDVLVEPSVAVQINCGGLDQALALIAAELAWRRLLPDPVALRLDGPWSVWSVARNRKVDFAAGETATFSDAAPPNGRDAASPFVTVGETHALALFDANPLAHVEDHPEKSGNAISLGDHPAGEWIAALDTALALIGRHLPGLRAEMRLLHRQFHPVGFDPQRHLSASYREYVGAMYLTLHPDLLTMATAIVHELGHSKLNLATFFDPLLRNERSFRVRSPVRPDPRPLMGVLLAAHAFVPVAELYRRILSAMDPTVERADVEKRLADVIARNAEALEVLDAHARPTPLGAEVLADLHRLHAEHASLPLTAPRPSAVTHDS